MSNYFERKPLKPRKPDAYQNAGIVSRDNQNLPPGELGLNERHTPPIMLIRPVYRGGYLVFRPWPQPDYQSPNTHLQPARVSLAAGGQSSWMIATTMASYVGLPECGKVSFNLVLPGSGQRLSDNPYVILYNTCVRARKFNTRIARVSPSLLEDLTKPDAQGKPPALTPPKRFWHVAGQVYLRGSEAYVGSGAGRQQPFGLEPEDPLPVIRLSDSAGLGLLDVLDRRKPDMEDYADTSDLDAPFKYPPITGVFDPKKKVLSGGLMVTVFNPESCHFSRQELLHSSYVAEQSLRDAKKQSFASYEVMVSRVWRDADGVEHRPDMTPAQVEQIFAKSSFWLPDPEDPSQPSILRFASFVEQVSWIAQAFRPCAALLEYAFVERDEWLAVVRDVCREQIHSLPEQPPVVPQGFAEPTAAATEEEDDPWGRSAQLPPLDPSLAHLRGGSDPAVLRPDPLPAKNNSASIPVPPPPPMVNNRRKPVISPLADEVDDDELNDY